MSFWKSFLDGYLDLYRLAPGYDSDSNYDRYLPGPAQDAQNLAEDWQRVGDYLRHAMAAELAKARQGQPESAVSSESDG